MKQLALAADLSALPNHYQLKRNFAYALYETGDVPKAIALLQDVIKMMEDKGNSYLAGTERIKQAKENLQKMKTGKKINYRISDMISY
jgi:predicted Zn-dependent protease